MLPDLLRLSKKTVIYGKGKSGEAALKFLAANNIPCLAIDDADGSADKWIGENQFADILIISPGICPDKVDRIPHRVLVSALDLELLLSAGFFKIGVTGSAGKSTTCNILSFLIDNSFVGGNFGNSFLDTLGAPEISCLIVEASSYQLEYHKYSFFDGGVLTSIFPNHLKRHKTFENYLQAKLNLVKHIKKRGFLVCQKDFQAFDVFSDCAQKRQLEVFTVSQHDPKADVFMTSERIQVNFLERAVNLNELIKLDPNAKAQFALALPVALRMGFSLKTVLEKVQSYKPLPYRFETICTDPLIINDSKSTSIPSLIFSARKIFMLVEKFNLISGGRIKQGENLEQLRALFVDLKNSIQLCICFGESRKIFSEVAESAGIKTVLVDKLSKLDPAFLKEATLFSPGAESFDEFSDFADRGYFFTQLARSVHG